MKSRLGVLAIVWLSVGVMGRAQDNPLPPPASGPSSQPASRPADTPADGQEEPAPPAPPAPPAAAAPAAGEARRSGQAMIAGVWYYRSDDVEYRADFRADGRFFRSVRHALGGFSTRAGRFRLSGNRIRVMMEDSDEAVIYRLRWVDVNTIDLLDPEEGETLRLTRLSEPPGGGAGAGR